MTGDYEQWVREGGKDGQNDDYPGPDMPEEVEAEMLLDRMGTQVESSVPHDALLLDFSADAAVTAMEKHWGW